MPSSGWHKGRLRWKITQTATLLWRSPPDTHLSPRLAWTWAGGRGEASTGRDGNVSGWRSLRAAPSWAPLPPPVLRAGSTKQTVPCLTSELPLPALPATPGWSSLHLGSGLPRLGSHGTDPSTSAPGEPRPPRQLLLVPESGGSGTKVPGSHSWCWASALLSALPQRLAKDE